MSRKKEFTAECAETAEKMIACWGRPALASLGTELCVRAELTHRSDSAIAAIGLRTPYFVQKKNRSLRLGTLRAPRSPWGAIMFGQYHEKGIARYKDE